MKKDWEVAQEIMARLTDYITDDGARHVIKELKSEAQRARKEIRGYRETNLDYISRMHKYQDQIERTDDIAEQIRLNDKIKLLRRFRKQNKHQIERLKSEEAMKTEVARKLRRVLNTR